MIIGRPLTPINHVCLADDYNKLVTVLKPFQNLTLGTGINGSITTNGVSISLAPTNSNSFDHPFKVESMGLSSANITFGRVYEEGNFNTGDAYNNLTYKELSSSITFDSLSGMDLQLNSTINEDTIVIAIAKDNDGTLDNNLFQVSLSSSVDAEYFIAAPIAKITKEENATSWTVEQIHMGDYSYARKISVPFEITRYGDKWVIYLPVNSLCINGEDWTKSITNLTSGVTPLVDDWYELKGDGTDQYLNVVMKGECSTVGIGYGQVEYIEAIADGTTNGYHIYEVDSTNILSIAQHGAIDVDRIRPDTGDGSNSCFKSLAVQGTEHGIIPSDSNFTLELHGFQCGLPLQGTLNEEGGSYSHMFAVREEGPTSTELRWTSLSSITPSAEPFNFPFKTVVIDDNINIEIIVGRVYEYNSFSSDVTVDIVNPFSELLEDSSPTIGSFFSFGAPKAGTIVITRNNSYNSTTWKFEWEDEVTTQNIIAKIARVYADGSAYKVEQIHMGDVSWSDQLIAPFTVVRQDANYIVYLPANSIIINGIDQTANQYGLTASNIPDWMNIHPTDTTYLYIIMQTLPCFFGSVSSLEFNTYGMTYGGTLPDNNEVITMPIYNPTLKRNFQIGAINREILRGDYGRGSTTGEQYRSIMTSPLNNEQAGDRTLALHGFYDNLALNASLIDTEDDWTHSFAVREKNTLENQAFLKWCPFEDLVSAIGCGLIECGWEPCSDDPFCLTTEFFNWYDSLSASFLSGGELSGKGFWRQNAGADMNYGSAIGNSSAIQVLDLDCQALNNGCWYYNDLIGDNLESCYVYVGDLTVTGALNFGTTNIIKCSDGTLRWQ